MEPINTNLDPSHPRPVISTWRSTPCTTVRPCPTSSCQTPATMTWRDPLLTSQGGCCTATRCQGASLLVTSTPAGWTPAWWCHTINLALSLTASMECPTVSPDSPPLPGPGPTLGLGKLLRVWLVFTPTIFIQSFSEESLYIIDVTVIGFVFIKSSFCRKFLVECLLKGVHENVPYFLNAFYVKLISNFVRFIRKFLITSQMSIPN